VARHDGEGVANPASPELAASVLSALDEIDHARAIAAASALRERLSLSR
jgi:hypothetical protein